MAVLGGLAHAAVAGKNAGVSVNVIVAIKVDGTWQSIFDTLNTSTNWKVVPNGSESDFALDHAPTYENTGGANTTVTDICVGVEQAGGDLVTGLNSNEAGEANNLIIPIHTVNGSPLTVAPAEIIQFTSIKTPINSV